MAHVPQRVIVAASAGLAHIVVLLGVGFHRDLGMTPTAFEVEPVYFDAEIVLVKAGLFTHVEFGAFV